MLSCLLGQAGVRRNIAEYSTLRRENVALGCSNGPQRGKGAIEDSILR
jgi:hypothetical protein